MRSRVRRVLLVALVVLLFLGASLLLLAPWEGADGDTLPGRTDRMEDDHASAVHLEGRGDRTPERTPAPIAEGSQAPPAVGPPAEHRVWLRGTVRVDDGGPLPPDLALQVWPASWQGVDEDPPEVGVAPDETGRFAIDLTELLAWMEDHSEARELQIHCDAPDCVRLAHGVPLPHRRALLRGEGTLDEASLVLQRAAFVEGRVLAVDGSPYEGYRVTAYAAHGNTFLEGQAERVRPTAEGRYRLRVVPYERYLVVGEYRVHHTHQDDLRMQPRLGPGWTWVDVQAGKTTQADDIRLTETHEITGQVVSGERPVIRPDLVWSLPDVRATLREDGEWPALVLVDDAVCYGGGRVSGDTEGRFRLTGLSERPHTVFVRAAGDLLLHPVVQEVRGVVVTPPKEGKVLDLPLATLALQVEHPGGPPRGTIAAVFAVGGRPDLPSDASWSIAYLEPDAEGRMRIGVTPEAPYAVHLEAEGFDPQHHEVESPPAGETLELPVSFAVQTQEHRLRLAFTGGGADAPEEAAVGLQRLEAGETPTRPDWFQFPHIGSGYATLEFVEPGRYAVWIRPGSGWHDVPSIWAEVRLEATVPGDPIRVPLRKGGAVRIAVTDGEGRPQPARCDVRDAQGTSIDATFLHRDRWLHWHAEDRILGTGSVWMHPVLLPGTYVLTFTTEGQEPVEKRIEVEAGRPVSLDVILR